MGRICEITGVIRKHEKNKLSRDAITRAVTASHFPFPHVCVSK